jgi:hypothetical protein
MRRREKRSRRRKGRVALYSWGIGRSKRELAIKRLSPTGGVL